MASFSALFRNGALRMRSTVTGQSNGKSVPYTIWLAPHSATRCRRPSSWKTIVSTKSYFLKYSLGRFLRFRQSSPVLRPHNASDRPL